MRWIAFGVWAVIAAAACGEVVVAPPGEADGPLSDLGDDSATLDGAPDLAPRTDTAPDTVADTAKETTATGLDCATDFDCVGLDGASPCNLPRCVEGFCKLMAQPPGAPCKSAAVPTSECTEPRCDDVGACTAAAKADGSVCGFGGCGKKCVGGSCVAAGPGDYEDGNPCTKDYCNEGVKVVHEPITDAAATCDDGNVCTTADHCEKGVCSGAAKDCSDGFDCTADACELKTGCAHTADAKKCDDGDPCSVDACDLAAGCTVTGAAAGKACDDGNACTQQDQCGPDGACGGAKSCLCETAADCPKDNLCLGQLTCAAGVCVADPKTAVVCPPGSAPCTKNLCDPKSGKCQPAPVADGLPCNDGNACTGGTACKAGACAGGTLLNCDDKNACTADSCSPALGCKHQNMSAPCDDGDACTGPDACTGGTCSGAKKACDDKVPCTLDACDPKTGKCAQQAEDVACQDDNPCDVDACDKQKGCVHQAKDDAKCDDGNPCTADVCKGGKCQATITCQCQKDADCDDGSACTVDTCSVNQCKNDPAPLEGKACDGDDKCQEAGSGKCAAGQCKSGNKAKDCSKLAGPCVSALCNPATGQCEALPKADGTGCDADGNGCTAGDACKGGKCTAGAAVDCASAADACNTAACVSKGGDDHACQKTPKSAATPCDDGLYCTVSDHCQGGACVGGGSKSCGGGGTTCSPVLCDEGQDQCAVLPAPATTACDDGLFCTASDHCDGKGGCVAGAAKECTAGTCQVAACSESQKACQVNKAADGAPCSDGNGCTTVDACKGGACQGGVPKTCTGDACNLAACDPGKGDCVLKPKPSGTSCSDGQPCTLGDLCDSAGTCKSGAPKSCPGEACQLGVCDKATGACGLEPKPEGAACNDGLACTVTDHCQSGACKGTYVCACKPGDATACNDKNPCTSDVCELSGNLYGCKNKPTPGATCDDAKPCTVKDSCTDVGGCGGVAKTCDDGNACTVDACDPANGACSNKPDTGAKCSDGNACTTGDLCLDTGKCSGAAVVCNDGNACTDDACDPTTGACKFGNNTAPCSDGNACTDGDVCSGGKCLAGKQKPCDDGNVCSSDGCDALTGACTTAANQAACSDGNACTLADACASLKCQPGKPVNCDDGNPCTDDPCNPQSGACSHPYNSAPCNDGSPCTASDTCKGGQCIGAVKNCDDGNPCTSDGCDKLGNCFHSANTLPCSDGNACTVNDVCGGGTCNPGTALACGDGNKCTSDTCSPKIGCTYPPCCDGTICGVAYTCGFLKKCYPKCFGGYCEKTGL